MGNKKAKIFLCIGFTFVAIYLICYIAYLVMDYYALKMYYHEHHPNELDLSSADFVAFTLLGSLLTFVGPAVGNGLFWIRSVYKMLKYNPYGLVKIIYVISSVLTFAAFAIACTTFLWWRGLWDYFIDRFDGSVKQLEIALLLMEWPIFIVSSILNCIPIKSKTAISSSGSIMIIGENP